MKIVITAFVALAALSTAVVAQVAVQGYYRKDGTYVSPHVRTHPNGICSDNYSGCR
jgi:hypothetical protein